ncbi:MAG TPA: hypothetical protein VK666_22600 [Chryseolinea sp.]|nr:hypothetical protein [Chryseolinea sp.]
MKKFLKKVTFFLVIPVIGCHIIALVVYLAGLPGVENEIGHIARSTPVLIVGDSQMQKYSPEFFGPNARNIASVGEHYFFTHLKLKRLFNVPDSKIKCVVIGVSVHNFSPMFQNYISPRAPEGKANMKRYLYFINIFNNDFVGIEKYILSKEFFQGVIQGPDWGGLVNSFDQSPPIPLIEKRLADTFQRALADDVKDFKGQELYLKKIVELCKAKGVHLVMVSSPVHEYFKAHVDKPYFDALAEATQNYDDVLYLNFLKDNVPSTYMNDPNHMNKTGADIYSKKINAEIARLEFTSDSGK